MLLEYHQGFLGSFDPELLKEIIRIAEEFQIPRYTGETDETYAERATRITRMSTEVPKLFANGTWDTGSVIDSITIGLASIIATNYHEDDPKSLDSMVVSLLASRIRRFRIIEGQKPDHDETDDKVRETIQKFQMIDRPTDGEDSEKILYARRVLMVVKMIDSILSASDATDFDIVEALCIELAEIFAKSPLTDDIIRDLISRVPETVKTIRKDNGETI